MESGDDDEMVFDNREIVPQKIKDVYKAAFNKHYPALRKDVRPDSEQVAHDAAWQMVKERFRFVNGEWKEK